MSTMHPNHDHSRPPQLPWMFPTVAGTAIVAVLAMVLLERVAG